MKVEYVKHALSNLIHIGKIVTVHYYEFEKDFCFEGEAHNFWELVYCDRGRVLISAADKRFPLHQGELAFHKPNEFHTIEADGEGAPNVFVLSFVTSSPAMSFFKGKRLKLPAKLKSLISVIIKESEESFDTMHPITGNRLVPKENAPIGGEQMIKTSLEQLLILLLRSEQEAKKAPRIFPTKESLDNHLVNEMLEIIGESLHQKISIWELCCKLNYSRTYLSRIFKENTGYTVGHYITEMKIKEAKRLIRENTENFTQIAERLGFESLHYFSRVFKRTTGLSPLEYKQSVKL